MVEIKTHKEHIKPNFQGLHNMSFTKTNFDEKDMKIIYFWIKQAIIEIDNELSVSSQYLSKFKLNEILNEKEIYYNMLKKMNYSTRVKGKLGTNKSGPPTKNQRINLLKKAELKYKKLVQEENKLKFEILNHRRNI